MPKADLHMHSRYSDGEWEPTRLVKAAKRAGVRMIALTDHDTVAGFEEAAAAGDEHGVEVLTGVEISTWLDADVHLLAYGFDAGNVDFSELLHRSRTARRDRAEQILERLVSLGKPLSMDDVLKQAGTGAIGRPHVARALRAAGLVASIREAFDLYLGDGRPACVEKLRISPADAVRLVHGAGGIAVAAHPGTYGGPEKMDRLVDAGIDGVEVLHPLHGTKSAREFGDYADRHGLVKTGGSDFHGPGPGGGGPGSVSIGEDWVEALVSRMADRQAAAEREGP